MHATPRANTVDPRLEHGVRGVDPLGDVCERSAWRWFVVSALDSSLQCGLLLRW